MKHLLLYYILFILIIFTKEKISFKSSKVYSYYLNCQDIDLILNGSEKIDDYPLNAQYCRLNDPNITELAPEVSIVTNTSNDSNTDDITPKDSKSVGSLRNLEENQSVKDKCCYVSALPKLDDSDWLYFCGKVNSNIYNNGVSDYVKKIKEEFKDSYKDIKIDCFSKKLNFMINILIISLIYLI
mgnify:CR=1 FL=1